MKWGRRDGKEYMHKFVLFSPFLEGTPQPPNRVFLRWSVALVNNILCFSASLRLSHWTLGERQSCECPVYIHSKNLCPRQLSTLKECGIEF